MTTYVLAVPPSANKLFFNVKGRGRVKSKIYRAWIKGELLALMAQRAKPVGNRASVSITLPQNTHIDCDNSLKGTVDLLVRAGVLPDDGPKYLGSLSVTFGDVQMMHVEVSPMAVAA